MRHLSDELANAFVLVVFIAVVSAMFFLFGGSKTSTKPYTVIHRDGRVWHLEGPPYGYGSNTGLPGQTKYYSFKDWDGFITRVDPDDCKVIEDQ